MTQELSYEVPAEAIEAFAAKVKAAYPEGLEEKYHSERNMRRFLLSRQLDIELAFDFWQKWVAWRKEHRPEEIQRAQIEPQLAVQVINIEGRDKRGHTCLVMRPRYHVPGQFPFEEMMRFTVWVLETATTSSKSADGYITAIWDCTGQGYKNMDPSLATAQDGIIATMKNFYPECLQLLLIVNANLVFRFIWRLILPFIDPRTRQKVKMISDHDELLEYFDPHDLPSDFAHVAEKANGTGINGDSGDGGVATE